MSSGSAARGRIDWVNQKVYNTPHQMTARTDRSELGRYSPAYATGRSAFVLQSKSEVEVEQRNARLVVGEARSRTVECLKIL